MAVTADGDKIAPRNPAGPQLAEVHRTPPGKPDPRPVLALRVGITGARDLHASQSDRLCRQLHTALDAVRQHMQYLASNADVANAYAHVQGQAPELRFISPLARGADRLAADTALTLGYALHVPMPFPQAEYEKDFTGAQKPHEAPLTAAEDLAQFRGLLERADAGWLALDGDHGPEMNRAYEAVGRYVVRHCDLLLAVWDGGAGTGRGGTADIVRYAATAGVPVWWIHATEDRPPHWLADIQDVRDPAASADPPEVRLRVHLDRLIRPLPPVRRHAEGVFGRLARLCQPSHVAPEALYYAERPRSRDGIWRANQGLIQWASGMDPPWTAPRRPDDPAAAYWFDCYQPADARAGDYAARYRSGYVLLFGLAVLALSFGALALGFGLLRPEPEAAALVCAGLEGIVLLTVAELLWLSIRREWHERSIEYRLLAELCRKQQTLAPLGWALSTGAVQRMAAAGRIAWVAWLFGALQRSAPFPTGDMAAANPPHSVVLSELIAQQMAYHRDREAMARRASLRLVHLSEASFAAVLLFVAGKVLVAEVGWPEQIGMVFGLFAVVLPGVSAACFGIRAYAELPHLAEQSHHMLAELQRAEARVRRLNPHRTLVSQDFGAEAAAVAMLMLQDLEGWTRLFRVKGLEPG